MLAADGLRGDDSTGVFCVEHNGNVHIAKEASNAYTFLGRKEASDIFHEILMRGAFAVGHNRAATRGAVIDRNAHPFCVDDKIVLVQNGTWVGDHKHVKNTEVDSEALAHIIAEEDNLTNALKRINAAYALVWYSVEKKELYMLRNKERPLYVAMTGDDGLVFASEPEIILFGASRGALKLKEKPYLLEESNLVTVSLADGTWSMTNKKVSTKYAPPKAEHTTTVIPTTSSIGQGIQQMFDQTVRKFRGGGGPSKAASNPHEIHNYIHSAAFVDWHVKDEQLARKHQVEYANRANRVYMEMIDYVPGEAAKDCKVWHAVFAEIQSSKEDPGPLFYMTLRGTDQKKLLEMIETPFRIAKVGSPIIHVLTDKQGNKEFITAIRIVEFMTEEEGDLDVAAQQARSVH